MSQFVSVINASNDVSSDDVSPLSPLLALPSDVLYYSISSYLTKQDCYSLFSTCTLYSTELKRRRYIIIKSEYVVRRFLSDNELRESVLRSVDNARNEIKIVIQNTSKFNFAELTFLSTICHAIEIRNCFLSNLQCFKGVNQVAIHRRESPALIEDDLTDISPLCEVQSLCVIH